MKVTFVKKGARRYAVVISRDRAPDLWCGTIGYDDSLPHDLLHFVAEAEYGLDGGVFGDLAAGGNARIFQSFDQRLTARLWRKQRIKRTRLPDGRRSEQLAWKLDQSWRAEKLPSELQHRLDDLATQWRALQAGQSLTLEWPRPEGRKRHPARSTRAPARRGGGRSARGRRGAGSSWS